MTYEFLQQYWWFVIALLAGLLVCTCYLVDATYNPFLYFRF